MNVHLLALEDEGTEAILIYRQSNLYLLRRTAMLQLTRPTDTFSSALTVILALLVNVEENHERVGGEEGAAHKGEVREVRIIYRGFSDMNLSDADHRPGKRCT